jgi:uncharacterized protein with von Willebrand factor type A (vWA) domain
MANYRYGRYVYGPDPLADSYDVRGAVDEMGDAILDGATPADALRDLLLSGLKSLIETGRPLEFGYAAAQ